MTDLMDRLEARLVGALREIGEHAARPEPHDLPVRAERTNHPRHRPLLALAAAAVVAVLVVSASLVANMGDVPRAHLAEAPTAPPPKEGPAVTEPGSKFAVDAVAGRVSKFWRA